MVDSKLTYTEMDGRSEDELRQSLLNALMTSTFTDDKFPVDKNSFQLSIMNYMSNDTMTSMPMTMTTEPLVPFHNIQYVLGLKFTIMANYSKALNNRSSEEFNEVEFFVTRYVNIYLFTIYY